MQNINKNIRLYQAQKEFVVEFLKEEYMSLGDQLHILEQAPNFDFTTNVQLKVLGQKMTDIYRVFTYLGGKP